MKAIKHILFLANIAVGATLLTACDDISENNRYIPVERPTVERVVLIQEFTGMRCSNCPNAAAAIHDLQNVYPDNIIAVGWHPEDTPYTRPMGGVDLTCPTATTYFNYYAPTAFPNALINGGMALDDNYAQWSTKAIAMLASPSPVIINATSDYNENTRELKVDYSVKFNQMYTTDCSVLVWIMENGIIGPQVSGSETIRDYTHNHVLRGALNGDWGEQLGSYFETEQEVKGSTSMTLSEKWKAENCQIVVFVYQTSSKNVEQAFLLDVIPTQTENNQ